MKHTKGPWKIGKRAMDTIFSGDDAIADVFPNVVSGKANARLIASAPELLEAVKELIEICITEGNWETKQASKFRNLIAKAEGES